MTQVEIEGFLLGNVGGTIYKRSVCYRASYLLVQVLQFQLWCTWKNTWMKTNKLKKKLTYLFSFLWWNCGGRLWIGFGEKKKTLRFKLLDSFLVV